MFRADAIDGTPNASDEGVPRWASVADPPYEEMWDGDDRWLPHVIAGRSFEGTLRFDADGDDFRGASLSVSEG